VKETKNNTTYHCDYSLQERHLFHEQYEVCDAGVAVKHVSLFLLQWLIGTVLGYIRVVLYMVRFVRSTVRGASQLGRHVGRFITGVPLRIRCMQVMANLAPVFWFLGILAVIDARDCSFWREKKN
jgi:hypothetical protein